GADVPFSRSGAAEHRWAHLGLYGYRRGILLRLASLAPTPLERIESLEQLRAVENGIHIRCVPTAPASIGVDTPEDPERAKGLLRAHCSELEWAGAARRVKSRHSAPGAHFAMWCAFAGMTM